MRRLFILVAMMALCGCTTVRSFAAPEHRLPDRPLTIVVMRPDVEVSWLTAGGVAQPNADWTASARTALIGALTAEQGARGNSVRLLGEQSGEAARLVADYEALHRTVADQIAQFKYAGMILPTKRGKFDWTLGPGVRQLGEMAGGGDYALFLYARDSFASDGRLALQIVGAALGGYVPGGERFVYLSLIDLRTGDIIWFNLLASARGDLRDPEGARATIDTLMRTLPARAGARP
ncbi:hypothetical protein GGR88_000727 [Sphingomonas jejuensis]|uniref:Lipoprotein n=1 Tax=Sphingomonas jejuensis TaxID=904715 RepID=A0ABX0XIU1_9SPHN|nr:hypothetical protein [Sphingomonas jejuensis]NJC33253.1 hypothetical protein [Sphingomonas jejuensis]